MEDSIPPVAGIIYGLYCTCHPERGIRYVGKTIQPIGLRLTQHRQKAKHLRLPSSRWILKHGTKNVLAVVLEECSVDELSKAELRHIEKLMPLGNLLNVIVSEQGHATFKHSAETRAKMSKSQKGRKKPPGTGLKVSIANTGKKRTPEVRAAISQRMMGKRGGENSPVKKLSRRSVHEIVFLLWNGFSQSDIAKIYGVKQGTVSRIAQNIAWKEIYRPWGETAPNWKHGRVISNRRKNSRVA